MNPNADKDPLLDDVFGEATPADFREALLGETLRAAGGRRRGRQFRRAMLLVVLPAMIAVLIWRNLPQQRTESVAVRQNDGPSPNYQLVRTEPLSGGAIVISQPLVPEQMVASQSTTEIIRTRIGSGELRMLNDDELLALVADRPAALVRLGPDSERLVFANPEDEAGFPLN